MIFLRIIFAVYCIFFGDLIYANDTGEEIVASDSVEIKQLGKNSLLAKEKAIAVALQKSFKNILIERFKVSSPLPHFTYKEISDCVYDYSIENEKYSDSIYICEILYRFDKKKLAQLLHKYGINNRNLNSEHQSKRCVKIAIYADDFIKNIQGINTLKGKVQKFSTNYVIIQLIEDKMPIFRSFGIKYAQL